MTNSEARKRMQARSGPESPLSRPQTANLGDGAIGLSEDERCALDDAITSAIYLAAETRKPTGHRIAAAVERILAARAQPEGKTRVEWGVRWDDVRGTSKIPGSIESSWTGPDGWSTGPYSEAVARSIAGSKQTLVRRTVTEFAPVVGEWTEVEETQP